MDFKPRSAAVTIAGLLLFAASGFCSSATAGPQTTPLSAKVFARVNGKPVTADMLNDKIEVLYPSSSVHGKAGGPADIRQKAIDELLLDELIWQQAVKNNKVVPLAKAENSMLRFRRSYGAQKFDDELGHSSISRARYVRKLQRILTIQQARREHVEIPSKIGLVEARSYYDGNPLRFLRPERARFRLILVAVEQNASKSAEEQAKKKADDLYAQLKAGKDFGELASEYSDDMYRVKDGDVGWMHKGSMDPEFEKLALTLPIGQFTAPFRTPSGYNLMKVEAREPAKQMSFDEIREKLQQQLRMQKAKKLEQDWEAALKKNAKVEIVDRNAGLQTAGPQEPAIAPVSSH